MILTKALIRLSGQAGLRLCCSQCTQDRFSRVEAQMKGGNFLCLERRVYCLIYTLDRQQLKMLLINDNMDKKNRQKQ